MLNKAMIIGEIVQSYRDGLSIRQIAAAKGMPASAVRVALVRAGEPRRSRGEGVRMAGADGRVGGRAPGSGWPVQAREAAVAARRARAAGVSRKRDGYVEVTIGENKGRGEHVVVVEAQIGRRIKRGEEVHHIDGDKHNNRLENLRLMTKHEHGQLHGRERAPLRGRDWLGRWASGGLPSAQ